MRLDRQVGRWSAAYVLIPAAVLTSLLVAVLAVALWGKMSAGAYWGTVIGAGLAGGVAVTGLWRAAHRAGRHIITGLGPVIASGDWVLKHATGSSPLASIEKQAALITGEPSSRLAELVWPLEDWLRGIRTRVGDDVLAPGGEMERDLQLAKEFQQAYLNRPYPKIPEVHVEGRLRLEFYHYYEPALALGGDFYDIIPLAPDCAGVFIADVMGHGTRSALITSMLRTLIGDLHHQARNAPHFLTELNKQFCGLLKTLPNPLFASAYYFVPDTTGRVATYSSAGHPAPFLVRSFLKRVSRLEVPPPRGAALGLIAAEEFTGGHVRLMPGDAFIFFTDGLYEAHNSRGEEFGVARVEALLKKLVYRGAREMVNGVMEALKGFVGDVPVMDDICVVAVEVTDKAAAGDTRT